MDGPGRRAGALGQIGGKAQHDEHRRGTDRESQQRDGGPDPLQHTGDEHENVGDRGEQTHHRELRARAPGAEVADGVLPRTEIRTDQMEVNEEGEAGDQQDDGRGGEDGDGHVRKDSGTIH